MSLIIRTTGWEDYMDPAGGSWVKMLIMGNPDVGKTRSASFWPKPIYADCEDGRMSLADRQVPYGRIRSTADMDGLITQLQFDNKRPPEKRKYQTLVIDTIDKFQKIVIQEKLAREGKDRLTGWADWGWLDGYMQTFISKLLNLDMNIIVNVHYKTVMSEDDDEKSKAIGQALRLKGDVKEWLIEEFDLIGMMESYYVAEDGARVRKRRIRWHNEPAFPLLKDRSGALPQFTEVDFTEDDYNRVFEALMKNVDSLPASATIEEIETFLEPEAAPANVTGGPVDPGKLPEKKVAAKKTVAKKVAAKTAAAEPGQAVTVDPSLQGTKDKPVTVDANKVELTNYNHAHAKDGTCLKNKYGELCGSTVAPEDPSTSTVSTPVQDPVQAATERLLVDKSTKEEAKAGEVAVALVKDRLGGTVDSVEVKGDAPKPDKFCGKQPDSHKKFPAAEGCGKDLDTEIPAKVNLALLRAKTMLCPDCFEAWKTAS